MLPDSLPTDSASSLLGAMLLIALTVIGYLYKRGEKRSDEALMESKQQLKELRERLERMSGSDDSTK